MFLGYVRVFIFFHFLQNLIDERWCDRFLNGWTAFREASNVRTSFTRRSMSMLSSSVSPPSVLASVLVASESDPAAEAVFLARFFNRFACALDFGLTSPLTGFVASVDISDLSRPSSAALATGRVG